jgi:hypothetical protein
MRSRRPEDDLADMTDHCVVHSATMISHLPLSNVDSGRRLTTGGECSLSKQASSCRRRSSRQPPWEIAYDNALAETTIGLYKTECTRDGSPFRAGPVATLADLEEATSAWVHWYNTQRLMHRLGRETPGRS